MDPTGHESRHNPCVTDGGGSIPVYPDEPLLVPKKKETKKVKVDKKQNMNKNPKNGFIQLDNEGDGYSIYNNQGNKENWGTPSTLDSLIKLGEEWSKNNSTLLQYGDISLKEGGPFKDHSSHQKGTNVDIRPVRKDGKIQGVNINSAGYSREKTRELIILLSQDPNTSSILFNDKILIEEFKNNKGGVKIRQFKGHDDHLHITFKK